MLKKSSLPRRKNSKDTLDTGTIIQGKRASVRASPLELAVALKLLPVHVLFPTEPERKERGKAKKNPAKPVFSTAKLRTLFASLVKKAQRACPHLKVKLQIGKAADFPQIRNFAMCGPGIVIVAPKIVYEPRAVVEALLRHELAHAVMFACQTPDHSERATDSLAESLFGAPIYYDRRDVETLCHAPGHKRPRPAYLPV